MRKDRRLFVIILLTIICVLGLLVCAEPPNLC